VKSIAATSPEPDHTARDKRSEVEVPTYSTYLSTRHSPLPHLTQTPRPRNKMPFDATTLSSTHSITHLSIQSNTQISPKATTIISKFSPSEPTTTKDSTTTTANQQQKKQQPPPLIILRAQARWASKLISIVEIAKRNLEQSTNNAENNTSTVNNPIKIFQYSSLSSELIETQRRNQPKKTQGLGLGAAAPEGQEGAGSDDDDDDEGAFQTMDSTAAATSRSSEAVDEGGMEKKKRAVPVLTVYLAGAPVKALRSEFG